MKCFSCGKNFDYEKYYGICPKCGCYNKREVAEEQHQQMHNVYDDGYRHSEATHGYGKAYLNESASTQHIQSPYTKGTMQEHRTKRSMQGSTRFLLIALAVFLLVLVGGTFFIIAYETAVVHSLQDELIEAEVEKISHNIGESFAFQGMELIVNEALVLATDEEMNLPEGKKLIAIQLQGMGDGEWETYNELSDAYIFTKSGCYWQIPYYEFEAYGDVFGYPAYDPYALSGEEKEEGFIGFLVDRSIESVEFCLEERSGENLVYLDRIHSVTVDVREE